jgi:hypothetical protein
MYVGRLSFARLTIRYATCREGDAGAGGGGAEALGVLHGGREGEVRQVALLSHGARFVVDAGPLAALPSPHDDEGPDQGRRDEEESNGRGDLAQSGRQGTIRQSERIDMTSELGKSATPGFV